MVILGKLLTILALFLNLSQSLKIYNSTVPSSELDKLSGLLIKNGVSKITLSNGFTACIRINFKRFAQPIFLIGDLSELFGLWLDTPNAYVGIHGHWIYLEEVISGVFPNSWHHLCYATNEQHQTLSIVLVSTKCLLCLLINNINCIT